ncbi:cobalt-precorrin-5B (C(1))-methyltransferase [Oribacterium sp. Sow4_G1_1]|uniref:cobalt-precorrin-5B (C(1))-methyltransferase n=1 Tax=Oribacterium sp. Sow4_G1_1 TaxID=3438794 RepID=UPI003F9B0474
MNEFVFKNQKKLRCGLTTGTCAAACAQAAMLRLLTGQVRSEVTVRLPESRKRVQVDVAAAKLHAEIADNRANRGTQQNSDGRSPLQRVGSAESDSRSFDQRVTLAVYPTADGGFATRKDAGDDPDVTNGTEIRAYIQVCDVVVVPEGAFASADGRLYLTGGVGVGRVTKPGLEQAVGQSAINRVPRQMIFDAVQQVLDAFEDDEKRRTEGCTPSLEMENKLKHVDGKPDAEYIRSKCLNEGNEKSERSEKPCYLITISVPAGAELAQRTFNPMLGIEGGISILGTTGIVEPMSEAAIVATIETSIRQVLAMEDAAVSKTETLRKEEVSADQKTETSEERTAADEAVGQLQSPAAHGEQKELTGSGRKDDGDIGRSARRILAVPGNYGQRYVEQQLGLRGVPVVEVSNYIGEAIDLAVSYGATDFLLVGNVGKLVKLAAGIMNTHSRVADGRWEIFAAHLALCGGTRAQVAAMRKATTTEEMLTRLEEMGLRVPVMASIMGEIEAHMAHRIRGQMNFGVIVYSERFGRVGETAGAARLLEGFCCIKS